MPRVRSWLERLPQPGMGVGGQQPARTRLARLLVVVGVRHVSSPKTRDSSSRSSAISAGIAVDSGGRGAAAAVGRIGPENSVARLPWRVGGSAQPPQQIEPSMRAHLARPSRGGNWRHRGHRPGRGRCEPADTTRRKPPPRDPWRVEQSSRSLRLQGNPGMRFFQTFRAKVTVSSSPPRQLLRSVVVCGAPSPPPAAVFPSPTPSVLSDHGAIVSVMDRGLGRERHRIRSWPVIWRKARIRRYPCLHITTCISSP